jgi:hypothetical protein
MEPKLCIDCKHFVNKRECKHPSNGIDLIDGKTRVEWCAIMRLEQNRCKPEALLFEPQEAVIYDLADLFPEAPFPSLERTTK